MPVETLKLQSITPQDGMEKPVNPPAQRVTVATSSKFADNDRLALLVDGANQVLVPKRDTYLARDVSFAIFEITGVREPYAIRSFVTEKRKHSLIKATKVKKDNGSLGYGFDQETFVSLINAVLPEMELYKPFSGDLLLPNRTIVPRSKSGLEDNFLHCILEETTAKSMKRSKLADKFRGGKSPKEALIRCNTLLNATRERLRSFGYDIVNTVSHSDATKFGKEPAYRLEQILDDPGIVKSKASIPKLPPPNGNLTLREEKSIEEVKGQLALNATDTILSHMQAKDTENLKQIEPNLENFFLQWFSKRPHSRVNFSDIVKYKKNQGENLGKFFIHFFRTILESASVVEQPQLTPGLEANIIANYRKLKEKGYTVEGIIQKVCKHFHIQYEKPPKPTTSSPES